VPTRVIASSQSGTSILDPFDSAGWEKSKANIAKWRLVDGKTHLGIYLTLSIDTGDKCVRRSRMGMLCLVTGKLTFRMRIPKEVLFSILNLQTITSEGQVVSMFNPRGDSTYVIEVVGACPQLPV
jgi:hypothetical protein